MTKKDFALLAEMIRFMGLEEPVRKDRETLRVYLAKEMADTLAGTNPRFDRERFLRACCPAGVEGSPAWLSA